MSDTKNAHFKLVAKEKLITFIVFSLGVLFLLLVYKAYQIVLILFAAILFACFLLGISRWVTSKTSIPEKWSLWITVFTLLIMTVGLYYFIGYRIAGQFDTLSESLNQAVINVKDRLQESDLGNKLLDESTSNSLQPEKLFRKGLTFFSSFLGILMNLLVFIALSLFIAASPKTYVTGITLLFPKKNHKTVTDLLGHLSKTLFRWLAGRLIDMTILGVFTGLGLWILGIPLALTLGILAAILSFIPNIGPFLAAVPPILLAFTIGIDKVIYVIILFIVIQLVESYLLTPFIQKKAVEVPPVLLLVAQIILTILAGMLGLLLATPLIAVILVLVKKVYIEKVLGENLNS